MYTTRSLSLYKHSQEAVLLPPDGPNSGYLVLQDANSTPTCNLGTCTSSIKDMPFPQNKSLSIERCEEMADVTSSYYVYRTVYMIPVINQPLASNRYYAIKASGRHKGKAYASSKEEDTATCCFCFSCSDVKPRTFDPQDIYQQFEFSVKKTSNNHMLVAKSVTRDGVLPSFLQGEGWLLHARHQNDFTLGEAQGLDSSLRAQLPEFEFPSSLACSKSVVVGKWYCPFMFIKDSREKDQMKKSMFYEMTLEQRWENIFAADKSSSQGNVVTVDVVVSTEVVRIAGEEATQVQGNGDSGMVLYKSVDGRVRDVQLSSLIVERMMWEEERVGWDKQKEKHFRVIKDEEYEGIGDWSHFDCYMLVETFVLKRNDGSIVLTYDFKHTNHIRSKWLRYTYV